MNDESQELSGGYTKHALKWIHLQLKSLYSSKDQTKILYVGHPLFELDRQIIDVALNYFIEHIVKNCLYQKPYMKKFL